jgi:hypothetical protein
MGQSATTTPHDFDTGNPLIPLIQIQRICGFNSHHYRLWRIIEPWKKEGVIYCFFTGISER